MKMGANFLDKNRIAEMVAEGYSEEDISRTLKIHLDCIRKQVAGLKGKAPKAKSSATNVEMSEGGTAPKKG